MMNSNQTLTFKESDV